MVSTYRAPVGRSGLPCAAALLLLLLAQTVSAQKQERTLEQADLYPQDRVVQIEIEISDDDWNEIRRQRRDFRTAFGGQNAEPESPYTYVTGSLTIDGVKFDKVGVRKKGFFGSQSSSRPSLKIKLNHVDRKLDIDGLKSLTLNNNKQDSSCLSQFMSYAIFEQAGLPAPRCSLAKVKVNGRDLGIYSHVESARPPLAKRAFGDDKGVMYEGTINDFHAGREGRFERKFGPDEIGREKIKQVVASLQGEVGDLVMGVDVRGRALVPPDDRLGTRWTRTGFDDSRWIEGKNGAGFEGQTGYESHISPEFDFKEAMNRKQMSLYLRFPFVVDNPTELGKSGRLTLRMMYDDGFVAYLNGHRVAAANAPEKPQWDSKALRAHPDSAAVAFASFDISGHEKHLKKGKNLLAIHGMNASKFSSDMLMVAELRMNKRDTESMIGEVVDLDSFYHYWAMESLLGAWDGYAGNANNYFIYLNPNTKKFHFIPWGADALFQKFSMIDRRRDAPISVKTKGLLAHYLYELESGRKRYAKTMRSLLEKHWDEKALLAETDRIHKMISAQCNDEQLRSYERSRDRTREFIRTREQEILAEIKNGMPEPTGGPARPFGFGGFGGGNRNGNPDR